MSRTIQTVSPVDVHLDAETGKPVPPAPPKHILRPIMPFGWVATHPDNHTRCSPLCQYLAGLRCTRFEVDMMGSLDGPMRNMVCMSSNNEAEEMIRLGGKPLEVRRRR
jgi:hypothetical protein